MRQFLLGYFKSGRFPFNERGTWNAIAYWTMVTFVAGATVEGTVTGPARARKAATGEAQAAQKHQVGLLKEADDKEAAAYATAEAQSKAKTQQKKRAISRSNTIFTSPLGLAQEAQTAKKTLLGQ